MKYKFLNVFLCLGLLCCFNCKKEELVNDTYEQQVYHVPSINLAKSYFNTNSIYGDASISQLKTNQASILTDWEVSTERTYKETPQEVVDILYTPIYINTTKNLKAFVATAQHNGSLESKIFTIAYKNNNTTNNLSAYIFIYGLDGNLEREYNYENGQQVDFQTVATSSNPLSKSVDCSELPSFNFDELIEWASMCVIALNEVVVVAQLPTIDAGDSSTGGFGDSTSLPPGSIFPEDYSPSGSGSVSPLWFNPNLVGANPFSISTALGIQFNSLETLWLSQLPAAQSQLLDAIAAFLNNNKVRSNRDMSAFSNDAQNGQLPEITDEAAAHMLDIINFLIDNPDVDFSEETLNQIVIEEPDNPIEDMAAFLECFDPAQGAEFTIYADQPIEDSQWPYTLSPPTAGHAFVSITQNGNTAVFGFYPQSTILGVILSNGAIGNNQNTPFDVSYTTDIEAAEVAAIINYASEIPSFYNVNLFNCTDYAIHIGNLAGLDLPGCYSPWYPGGGGSAPSVLGQHLRHKQTSGTDSSNTDESNSPSQSSNCN